MHFFGNTPRSVRDLQWSRAAGTRAWLAEIHFERFTCRAEIACLVRVCREALCLDGNVCHQFSPRRWVVVRQSAQGTAGEGDSKTAVGILSTDACGPSRLLTTSAIIPKMFKFRSLCSLHNGFRCQRLLFPIIICTSSNYFLIWDQYTDRSFMKISR